MYLSAFNIKVDDISINDLAVTLRLTDDDGNHINVFFNNLWEVREFARTISHATEKIGMMEGWDND